MGYNELKELVKNKLIKDDCYLDEQIDVFDEKVSLFKACGIAFPKGEEKSEIILDWLIQIRNELIKEHYLKDESKDKQKGTGGKDGN